MSENFINENFSHKVFIRITDDEMRAFITIVDNKDEFVITKDLINNIAAENGIRFGILDQNVTELVNQKIVHREILIASGKEAKEGEASFYEFHFNTKPKTQPTINPDGTVNYWSMSLVENVTEGQVIATYHPALQGEAGMTVTGKSISAKIMKDLPALKGKGFKRAEDNVTYIATTNGKIEYMDDRIHISNIYELYDDVDYNNGKIDFRGDVIIHGNVMSGTEIQAYGSVTIDGNVEGAKIVAKKDIVLRSGVQGDGKAWIKSGGNIYAKFIESAKVEAGGFILANVLMNSTVFAGEYIELNGNRATIVGGYTYAVKWIRAMNVGNATELRTKVAVGINDESIIKIREITEQIENNKQLLMNLNVRLARMDDADKELAERMGLFRDKIKYTSLITEYQMELSELLGRAENARGSYIEVMNVVHPGVTIQANSSILRIRESIMGVQFKLRGLDIEMSSLSDEEVSVVES